MYFILNKDGEKIGFSKFKPKNQESKKMTQKEIEGLSSFLTPKQVEKYISEYRRLMENGGVEVDGSLIQTDSESRANILGASQLGVTVNWKTENGFVELSAEQLNGIAFMVGTHVQKCFNAERIVYEAHGKEPFTSKDDVEKAFNDAYKNN